MGLLTPDRYVTDAAVVDLEQAWAAGKRALLVDRDNTIVPRDTKVVPPRIERWLADAHAIGFKLCLVSNNWAKNVRPDAGRFKAELVSRAAKPLPFALWHALRKLGVARNQALFVGDQVFTDLLGGKLAGIETVLVQPLTEVDLAHTLVLRKLERLVIGGLVAEGPSGHDGDPNA